MIMVVLVLSISALLIGLLETALLGVGLVLFGLLAEFILGYVGVKFTPEIRKAYMVLVALICLISLVLVFFGLGPMFALR